MSAYIHNRACSCQRCRFRGLIGAAILITVGVLFLVEKMWYIGFGESWPALLIVIGLFLYLGNSAPIEGHVNPHEAGNAGQLSDRPHDPEVKL